MYLLIAILPKLLTHHSVNSWDVQDCKIDWRDTSFFPKIHTSATNIVPF